MVLSCRGQQLKEVSSQGSVQSGIDLLVNIRDIRIIYLYEVLRDPVCHAGDWEGVRPWPRAALPAGRSPDGADDRTPDEEAYTRGATPRQADARLGAAHACNYRGCSMGKSRP